MSYMQEESLWITATIYGLGVVGNTVSVVVWSVLVPTIGGARFFIALSLSDLLADIFGILSIALKMCLMHVIYHVHEFFYYLSAHLTVAMVMHRLLSVARPFSAQGLCSKHRQLLTIAALVLLTAVDTVGSLIFKLKAYKSCRDNRSGSIDRLEMKKTVTYIYTVFNVLLTVVLTVFNFLLIWKIRNMQVRMRW